MEIKIFNNYEELSLEAAKIIKNEINKKRNLVLGLATGSTPIKTYSFLTQMFQKKEISFKEVVTFNLDEYIGLEETNINSYRYFMNHNFFNNIDIDKKNTFIPLGLGDVKKNCNNFEEQISQKGPIDLQILGLGQNCHIGFNEPGCSKEGLTSKVKLTNSTIKANKRFFSSMEEVPKEAISMGIKTIMKAKKILLLVSGKNKAEAIKNTLYKTISNKYPSSFLREHPNVIILLDKEASTFLKK